MSVIIRLQNLPISANASNIRRFFGGLSIPEGGVHIVGGNEGDAFIAFATDEDARKAMLLDRQSINGSSVRLFLSSKTEMQSIIESARTSALFSGSGTVTSQSIPQKTETMHALDVTAPTLPSSFSSYRNGVTRDSPYPNETTNPFNYPYNKGTSASTDTCIRQPPESSSRPKHEDYSVDLPTDRAVHPDRDRNYGYVAQSSQPPRYDEARDPMLSRDYGLPREGTNVDRNGPMYRSYYDEYDFNRRPPVPVSDEHFIQRNKDVGMRNSPRDNYVDHYLRPGSDDIPSEYGGYNRPSSPRPFPERFPPSDFPPRDVNRPGVNSFPDVRGGPGRPMDRDPSYPNPRLPEERDFSVRPPWLNDELANAGPKRPFQPPVPDYEDYPLRKRRPPPPYSRPTNEQVPAETEFVVRVSLPISDVGIKPIFEILRGVHIVQKWGIRIEEDALQRPTGYVFIMTTDRDSYDRALSFDNRNYKSGVIRVSSSSLDEFYQVTDSNFSSKCPSEIARKLPPLGQCSPPHYSDGCLELAELPSDTSKAEVVRFLGAPGLTVDNVSLAKFPFGDKAAPRTSGSLRALVTLPSPKDLKILLTAEPRPFRPDVGLPPVRLTPISKVQLTAYSSSQVPEKTDYNQESTKPSRPPDAVPETTKTTGSSPTCAFISGFSHPLKDSEVLRLFPSVLIPGDAIRMGPENTSAYIDFISENNCRRAVAEVSADNSKAKQAHPSLRIETIYRSEMKERISSFAKNDEGSTFDRPIKPRDRDPRDSRNQWDSRPRPHHQPVQFGGRSPSSARQNFNDNYYDRPGPPPTFEDFHNDQFSGPMRRPRPLIDNPNPGMPQPDMMARQPLPGPVRRSGPDFVTVFIGNFPPNFTVDQLAAVMRDYYFIPGSIRLRRDPQGQFVGEALVDFKSSYEADRALRGLNGFRIAGRPLVLRFEHRA